MSCIELVGIVSIDLVSLVSIDLVGIVSIDLVGHWWLLGLNLHLDLLGYRYLGLNMLGLGLNGVDMLGLAIHRIGINLHVVGLDLHCWWLLGRNVHLLVHRDLVVLDLFGLMSLDMLSPVQIAANLLHIWWPPPEDDTLFVVLHPKVFFNFL